MVEIDFTPGTLGFGATGGFQRYTSFRGDTTTVGVRFVGRAYGEPGFKAGFGGAGAVKFGVDKRVVNEYEITFKNGSFKNLSTLDRWWSFNPVNPIPSVGRGLQLARENPNDVTVTTRERFPLKLQGRGALSAGAYAGIGGKLSGSGGVQVTFDEGTSTTRTESWW
jgi:hypothetical protein